MNEFNTIINLAGALSKSYEARIERLDIRYNFEKHLTEANLYLEGAVEIVRITGRGEAIIFCDRESHKEIHKKEEPDFIKELDAKEDFEAKRKRAMDKILKKDEEARQKISEELSTQTAAEAMEGMKNAVDNLEIKKKPKRSESGWAGARPKDRHEKILKLYNEGWTKVKMAEELGIGISTVNYHLQKLRDEGKI